MHPTLVARLHARFQRLIQTRVWGIDIHPTAKVATTALIDRTWPQGIHIGRDCVISHEAVILSHDLSRAMHVDTWIGDRTYIGARAIVLPGLTVGEDCLVMPGALVTKDMPDNSMAVGNPATVSPRVTDDDAPAARPRNP